MPMDACCFTSLGFAMLAENSPFTPEIILLLHPAFYLQYFKLESSGRVSLPNSLFLRRKRAFITLAATDGSALKCITSNLVIILAQLLWVIALYHLYVCNISLSLSLVLNEKYHASSLVGSQSAYCLQHLAASFCWTCVSSSGNSLFSFSLALSYSAIHYRRFSWLTKLLRPYIPGSLSCLLDY